MPRRQALRSASTGSIGSANGDRPSGLEASGRANGGGRRGIGKRSSSNRPRAGVELSAQDVERVIRQSKVQVIVALEVVVAPGEVDLASAIQAFSGGPGEEPTITGEKPQATARIPLLECGVRDWKHLVALQRIIASQRRPVAHLHTARAEADGEQELLTAEARVQHDSRRRDTVHLALQFRREAENMLWRFVNDVQLRLQSAGITSRPLLPVMQRLVVRLSPDVESSRSKSRRKSSVYDHAALHWTGKLEWYALVASTETPDGAGPATTQRTLLSMPQKSSELKYPELKPLVETWISENRDSRLPIVVILRGIPGSGKSTLGRELRSLCSDMGVHCSIVSADLFFETPRGYVFDVKGLDMAHGACKDSFSRAILASLQRSDEAAKTSRLVIVDNTNTQQWEYAPYQAMAAKYGCAVRVLEMKCADASIAFRMGQRNSHGVAPSKVVSMFLRWEDDPGAYSFTPQFDDTLLSLNPVTDKTLGGKIGYVGLFLDASARESLLEAVPPAHQNVTADHVTVFYKPSEQFIRTVDVGSVVMLRCVEVAWDARGQAIRVELLQNSSEVKIRNKVPHVTISTANGISSSYSNELLGDSSASRVAISPGLILPATLGFSAMVQNQRVIMTHSPFAFSDSHGCNLFKPGAFGLDSVDHSTASELGDSSPTARLCVVSIDEAKFVNMPSELPPQALSACYSSGIRDGCLQFDKFVHHLAASCSSYRVLLLKMDPSTVAVSTTQVLQYVCQNLDPGDRSAVMFDEVIRGPSSVESDTLSNLLQRDSFRGLRELLVLTSSTPEDVVLPKNLDPTLLVSTIAVTAEGSRASFRHQEDAVRPLKPALVLDSLGLSEEEHTRHQVLRACQKLMEAAETVLGPNEVVTQRIDSTVLGLPAHCITIGLLLKQDVLPPPMELQQLVASLMTQLTKSRVHSMGSNDPSRFYIQMCSSIHRIQLFRVQLVLAGVGDAATATRDQVALANDIRGISRDVCPSRVTYGAFIALVRGVLRSEGVWSFDGFQAPALINFICEQLACIYLRSTGSTSDMNTAQSSSILLLELLQLATFVEHWSSAEWEANLDPVFRVFPAQSERFDVDILSQAFKSLAECFDCSELGQRPSSPDGASELLATMAARPHRSTPVVTTTTSCESLVKVYAEVQSRSATKDTALESLAVSDALRDLATLDSINPMRERFDCAIRYVGSQIDIVSGSLELLGRIRDAFNDASALGDSVFCTAHPLVIRDAKTDCEI